MKSYTKAKVKFSDENLPCFLFDGKCFGNIEKHHIIYRPAFLVPLCWKHHSSITEIHTIQALNKGGRLTNKERWAIWGIYLTRRISTNNEPWSKNPLHQRRKIVIGKTTQRRH